MTRRPNVLLINCDDVGYGDLGCYGSIRNKTPALDRLADQGARLTSFYQASPWCSPSRAALLTGCYPPRIGFSEFDGMPVLFPGDRWGLAPSEVTIARALSQGGYRTQAVGKWHCGDQPAFLPTNHGFDHFLGLPYSNDMGRQAGQVAAEDRDRIRTPPLPLLLDDQVLEQQPDQASLTARYISEAVRFIRDCGTQPFFLYLAHIYVHLPIYVQERFLAQSDNGVYGAAVESIDWATAVLLAELDRQGIADDTIVIFTSDNGSLGANGGSNAPLRGKKGTTWEGGMRVPCLIRWPGRIAPGRTVDALATSLDLFPTLCGWCNIAQPAGPEIDGSCIGSLLLDVTNDPAERVFCYYNKADLEAFRCGDWKLHFSKSGTEQALLFHIRDDPAESRDEYARRPDIARLLEARAQLARLRLGDRRLGIIGRDVRDVGTVASPVPLTEFDPEHPYYMAEYDLADRG